MNVSCRLSNSKEQKIEEGLEFSKSSYYEDDSSISGPKSKDDKYK